MISGKKLYGLAGLALVVLLLYAFHAAIWSALFGGAGPAVVVFELKDEQGRVLERNVVTQPGKPLSFMKYLAGLLPKPRVVPYGPYGTDPDKLWLSAKAFVRLKFSVKGDVIKYGFAVTPLVEVEAVFVNTTGATVGSRVLYTTADQARFEFAYTGPVEDKEIQLEVAEYALNVGETCRSLCSGVLIPGSLIVRVKFKASVKMFVVDKAGNLKWFNGTKECGLLVAEQVVKLQAEGETETVEGGIIAVSGGASTGTTGG